MLNNILLGYDDSDGSRTALAQAIDIAEAAGSWVHLVNVNETERGASLEMPGLQASPGAGAVAAAQAGLDPDERPVPDYPNVLADAVETCQGAQVRCTQRGLFGDPGRRLAEMGRIHNMVVVGQKRPPGRGQRIGSTLNSLLRHCSVPLMVCATAYQRLTTVGLLFWDDAPSGRALSVAAELCATMNVPLRIGLTDVDAKRAEHVSREIDYAMKGFHIEYETRVVARTAADATALSATDTGTHWMVMAYPPTLWPWQPSPLKTALMTPNLVRIFVP